MKREKLGSASDLMINAMSAEPSPFLNESRCQEPSDEHRQESGVRALCR